MHLLCIVIALMELMPWGQKPTIASEADQIWKPSMSVSLYLFVRDETCELTCETFLD